jgi:hypothetical protein
MRSLLDFYSAALCGSYELYQRIEWHADHARRQNGGGGVHFQRHSP